VAAAAAAGVAIGALLARVRSRVRSSPAEAADPRAEELRRKLVEARTDSAEEEDFQAAGMGAETMVEEQPRRTPAPEPEPADVEERPPSDEFEAMRRRIHEEGRAAADEMRRGSEPGGPGP
jgi:hypothetical protein